jgi:methylated-DNA-protein-cysteine methyltransferase related protein
MAENSFQDLPTHERIYFIVRQIPSGKVATYGQIARIAGGCTARMVGYALSALSENKSGHNEVPWQRVINRMGKISPHGAGFGSALQRALLEEEGVIFDPKDRVDFSRVGWKGLISAGAKE